MQCVSAAQETLPELAECQYRAALERATQAFATLISQENGGSFRDAPEILRFRPRRLSLRERLDKLAALPALPRIEPEPAPEQPVPQAAAAPRPRFQIQLLEDVEQRRPTVREVTEIVRAHFGLLTSDLLSHRRHIRIVRPRQIIMYLCREVTIASYPEIGRRLGGRDHTTVLHAVQKIGELIECNPKIAADVAAIRAEIAARFTVTP